MVQTRGDGPPGSRHANLKKSFKLGVRSLLTAFSKEDVYKSFPTFNNHEKEKIHGMFIQVIKSLHENIEEEFEAICQETQVGATLDVVEQLVEEQSLETLPAQVLDVEEVKEVLSKVKRDEISYLSSLLEKNLRFRLRPLEEGITASELTTQFVDSDDTQAERQNELLKDRVESLRKARDDTVAATDAISKLRSWNSSYEKLLNG